MGEEGRVEVGLLGEEGLEAEWTEACLGVEESKEVLAAELGREVDGLAKWRRKELMEQEARQDLQPHRTF